MEKNNIKIGNYEIIIEQLGSHKFLTMTGSKILYYGYDDHGYVYLTLKLAKNYSKAQFLKIQLTNNDLYNLTFSKIKKTINATYKKMGIKMYDEEHIIINEYLGIYAYDLKRIFTEETGLLTNLF